MVRELRSELSTETVNESVRQLKTLSSQSEEGSSSLSSLESPKELTVAIANVILVE